MLYDLAIIGGGPAGLSAAISASCEGLKTIVLEAHDSFGGQSKESAMIHNYPLPFRSVLPVTGRELIDGFVAQASEFGCILANSFRVASIRQIPDELNFEICSDQEREIVEARSIILANGLKYKEHDAEGIKDLLYKGVYYGMPPRMPNLRDCNVILVGGANSAGQAALRMCRFPGVKVKIMCRKPMKETMSSYLYDMIRDTEDYNTERAIIEELPYTDLLSVHGKDTIEAVSYERDGNESNMPAGMVQFWIGADPNTAWLNDKVDRDRRGFIIGGEYSLGTDNDFETSHNGIFTVGDVRAGSVKRVVNAAGEGAAVIQHLMRYLG